jgi:hypothetical protein
MAVTTHGATMTEPAKRYRKYGQTLPEALPWILERVRSGIPINHACEAAGFSKQALYKHCKSYPESREELDQARAEGEEWLVRGLYDAARDDPKFGLLLLERRRPDDWGKADKLELTGKDGGAIEVTAKPLSRAEALAELRELAANDPEVQRLLLERGDG